MTESTPEQPSSPQPQEATPDPEQAPGRDAADDAPVEQEQAPPAEAPAPTAEPASPADAPATDAPATDAPATDAPATDAPATDAPATDAPGTDEQPDGARTDPGPTPPRPRPAAPRPSPVPTPAALRKAAHPAPTLTPSTRTGPPAESFGRVAEDGTVFVRTADGEREVGSYPGASPEEALHYFARKYDELWASADLLQQRVGTTDLSAKDAAEGLSKVREHAAEANVVGDLAALEAKIADIESAVAERRKVEAAERSAARATALEERERIVAEAEQIAAQPENKVQWKTSGARMRALLDEWKQHQRTGARLDRETEGALWQRFSAARNSFDKARRIHFAQLESSQGEAKAAKLELVKEAEALATSTDWGATAGAFKRLMDRWRQAGRASRADDDALWERFKAAQDTFFSAKDALAAQEDEEYRANLHVKEGLLKEAEAILPVTDLEAAKAQLRVVQDKWDAAGKVPRGDVDRIEKAMRRIEQAVRDADDQRWKKSNPEVAARARSMADQLEASVAALRADLAKAQQSGDDRKVEDARAKLEAQEQWLAQARGNLDEFGG